MEDLRAGVLREIISLERPERVQNSSGGMVTVYSPLFTTYAMVKEVESTPELIEQQVNITNIVSFVVRYRVAEPHFQINDVIIWRKYRFVINNIKADWKRSYLTLTATSEMETSDRNGGV